MKINNLIVKLEELARKLEKVGLGDVIVAQVHFQEDYDEEIYVSSATKTEESIFIEIEGHKTKVPQDLNRINLLSEVPRGRIDFSGFGPVGLGVVHYIKIENLEIFGKEAEEFVKTRIEGKNLCPECNVYCNKRFIDGRCE